MKNRDRVICVNAKGSPNLIKGKMYTVTGVRSTGTGIWLQEIEPSFPYVAFKAKRFQKVDESFAEGILENIKHQIEEYTLVEA